MDVRGQIKLLPLFFCISCTALVPNVDPILIEGKDKPFAINFDPGNSISENNITAFSGPGAGLPNNGTIYSWNTLKANNTIQGGLVDALGNSLPDVTIQNLELDRGCTECLNINPGLENSRNMSHISDRFSTMIPTFNSNHFLWGWLHTNAFDDVAELKIENLPRGKFDVYFYGLGNHYSDNSGSFLASNEFIEPTINSDLLKRFSAYQQELYDASAQYASWSTNNWVENVHYLKMEVELKGDDDLFVLIGEDTGIQGLQIIKK